MFQFAVLAVACVGLRLGLGDGFATRDRSDGAAAAVARTWHRSIRTIQQQVERLGLPG